MIKVKCAFESNQNFWESLFSYKNSSHTNRVMLNSAPGALIKYVKNRNKS
jgi:hypothetical protein